MKSVHFSHINSSNVQEGFLFFFFFGENTKCMRLIGHPAVVPSVLACLLAARLLLHSLSSLTPSLPQLVGVS